MAAAAKPQSVAAIVAAALIDMAKQHAGADRPVAGLDRGLEGLRCGRRGAPWELDHDGGVLRPHDPVRHHVPVVDRIARALDVAAHALERDTARALRVGFRFAALGAFVVGRLGGHRVLPVNLLNIGIVG